MGRHHKFPHHLSLSSTSPSTNQPPSRFSSTSSSSSSSSSSSISLLPSNLSLSPTRTLEQHIPGFRTSAAFFTALRANIDLTGLGQGTASDSAASTPDCLRPLVVSSIEQPPHHRFTGREPAGRGAVATLVDDTASVSALCLPSARDTQPPTIDNHDIRPPKRGSHDDSYIETLEPFPDSAAHQVAGPRVSSTTLALSLVPCLLVLAVGLIPWCLDNYSTFGYRVVTVVFWGMIAAAVFTVRVLPGLDGDGAEWEVLVASWLMGKGWAGAGESGGGRVVAKQYSRRQRRRDTIRR